MYGDKASKVADRTNEVTGTYAEQCVALATELGLPTINLWSKMQETDGWQKKFLRLVINLPMTISVKIRSSSKSIYLCTQRRPPPHTGRKRIRLPRTSQDSRWSRVCGSSLRFPRSLGNRRRQPRKLLLPAMRCIMIYTDTLACCSLFGIVLLQYYMHRFCVFCLRFEFYQLLPI